MEKKETKTVTYVCCSSTCGKVEIVTYAPSASKKCPDCGGTMVRR